MAFRAIILSDLHLLDPNRDSRYPLFLKALTKVKVDSSISHLILLGDVFDVLVGNFSFWTELHADFFKLLKEITASGKKIIWVQGNHDFQIKKLVREHNVEWVEHNEAFTWNGIKVYLSHGDLADWKDKLHPVWRAFLTSRFLGLILFFLPSFIVKKIFYPLSIKISRGSRKVSLARDRTEKAKHIFRKYAQKCAEKTDSRIVLLGHSHIAECEYLKPELLYMNVGSWYSEPQIGLLEIDPTMAPPHFEAKLSSLASWLSS